MTNSPPFSTLVPAEERLAAQERSERAESGQQAELDRRNLLPDNVAKVQQGIECGTRSRRDMLGLLGRHCSVAYQESLLTMRIGHGTGWHCTTWSQHGITYYALADMPLSHCSGQLPSCLLEAVRVQAVKAAAAAATTPK